MSKSWVKNKRNPPHDPLAVIHASKSWQARRGYGKITLAQTKERGKPNVDWYAPGLDPDDVTGGNGDG